VFILLAPCLLMGPQMKQSILSCSGASQNHSIQMKRILLALTFVGTLAGCLAGFAQTSSPAADATATAASVTPAKDAAPPAAAAEAAPAAQAPAPAAAASTPPTPAAPAPAAVEVAANNAVPPTAAVSTTAPADNSADNPANTAQPKAIIPLIVMDDVPLTDAIRNLARQAEINYMLDQIGRA